MVWIIHIGPTLEFYAFGTHIATEIRTKNLLGWALVGYPEIKFWLDGCDWLTSWLFSLPTTSKRMFLGGKNECPWPLLISPENLSPKFDFIRPKFLKNDYTKKRRPHSSFNICNDGLERLFFVLSWFTDPLGDVAHLRSRTLIWIPQHCASLWDLSSSDLQIRSKRQNGGMWGQNNRLIWFPY